MIASCTTATTSPPPASASSGKVCATQVHQPTGAALIEAALLLAAGVALIALVPRVRAHWSALLLAGLLALLAVAGLAAFKGGILIDVAGPALGTLAVFGALLGATLAEADRQRRLLREAQARVAGELEAARRIQMGLLPSPRRLFAGEARFSLDATLEPDGIRAVSVTVKGTLAKEGAFTPDRVAEAIQAAARQDEAAWRSEVPYAG